MYNFSGIVYRLWGECGIFALLGIVCLIIALRSDKDDLKKKATAIGIAGLLIAAVFSVEYFSALKKPDIQVFDGIFQEEYRNSRIAPPLPFTFEYRFRDEEGTLSVCYLDVFSKKEIYRDDFAENKQYRIYYEAQTQIILLVECLSD